MCVLYPLELTPILREGNNPPWFNQAKARHGVFEGRRAAARAGIPEIQFPEDLMPMSHTVLVSPMLRDPDHEGHIG